MKKILSILLVLIVVFSFAVCGSEGPEENTTKEPSYDISTTVEDGVTFYNVSIGEDPDWSKDDWWNHKEYARNIIINIQEEHPDDTKIWVTGFVNGNPASLVFSWSGVDNPKYLYLYKYDEEANGYINTDGVDLYLENGIWLY